jgi:predicted nucleic acid-binding Zn ribbon protein
MSEVPPESKVPAETVRTPVVGSRRCPVCGAEDLQGRQTACSASCRRERTRQREKAAREARHWEVRALLEAALEKLQEGGP